MKNLMKAIGNLNKARTLRIRRWTQTSLFLVTLLSFSLTGLAKADLQQVKATPYDRQMTPVRYLLEQPASNQSGVSMDEVNSYMSKLRAIPYQYSQSWKTPDQVQTEFKADCKSKAIALYSLLKHRGVDNLRLVIGMRTKKSSLTHAWLEMSFNGKQYLLDPTFFNSVRPANSISRNDYVQNFAYEGSKKFRI